MNRNSLVRLLVVIFALAGGPPWGLAADAPTPLLKRDQAVDWWFMFKLNSGIFPNCSPGAAMVCLFGGSVQTYKKPFGQQFVYASNDNHSLQQGSGCAGDSVNDPLGATFDEVYNGAYNYVIWNDQFYDDPPIDGCTQSCGGSWGHSKGMLSWNDVGEGFVLQVSTPSWPAAGGKDHPRQHDGNTLGCVIDNDILVSQHFFALRLTKDDVIKVLKALQNASVVTDPHNPQVVNVTGPEDLKGLVEQLGARSDGTTATKDTLSSGIILISKPSKLHVPPWQMVSALLDGVSLRVASWWARPQIYSTTATTRIACWDDSLSKPGAVDIATTGQWDGQTFGLTGVPQPNFNHAKVGVSNSGDTHYTIFGDMNQQGAYRAGQKCGSSQNGRGGIFYVIDDAGLHASIASLIEGDSAPAAPPRKKAAARKRSRTRNRSR